MPGCPLPSKDSCNKTWLSPSPTGHTSGFPLPPALDTGKPHLTTQLPDYLLPGHPGRLGVPQGP